MSNVPTAGEMVELLAEIARQRRIADSYSDTEPDCEPAVAARRFAAWLEEVRRLRAEVERATAESATLRDELAAARAPKLSSDTPYTEVSGELTEAHLALENFAGVYDAFLAAKGIAWCKHWESVPLHQLFSRDGVQFRMPTLEDCRRAKAAVEGEMTLPAPPKGERQS